MCDAVASFFSIFIKGPCLISIGKDNHVNKWEPFGLEVLQVILSSLDKSKSDVNLISCFASLICSLLDH